MNKILQEVYDKTSEYLEMIEADEASTAIIHILCGMILNERNDKEFYKAYYDKMTNQAREINT